MKYKCHIEKRKQQWKGGRGDNGGHRGRYEVVGRVTITAVKPNLISVIDRIRLTKKPNQLDIH